MLTQVANLFILVGMSDTPSGLGPNMSKPGTPSQQTSNVVQRQGADPCIGTIPVVCRVCGYAMAGLARDVPCPECGSVKRLAQDRQWVWWRRMVWTWRSLALFTLLSGVGAMLAVGRAAAAYNRNDAAWDFWSGLVKPALLLCAISLVLTLFALSHAYTLKASLVSVALPEKRKQR